MKKTISILVLAIIAFVVAAETASAQASFQYSPLIKKICDLFCRSIITGPFTLNLANTTGEIEFEWVANSLPGATRASSTLQATSLTATGSDATLGNINISLDNSRTLNSTITSNEDGNEFPATSSLRFHAKISIPSQRAEYQSIDEIVLENTDLRSWPHNNTAYNQVGSARFEKVGDPAAPQITLSGVSVTVTQR